MKSEGISDFGNHPIETVSNDWQRFLTDADNRKAALASELSRQQHNESLRVNFAQKASALKTFIQDSFQFVNNLPGSLEEQLENLNKRKPSIVGAVDKLNEAGDLSAQLEAAGVTENKHTDIAFPTLKVDYEGLVKVTTQKETILQKEILQQKNKGLSAEQVAEFKEVFDHFDKDKRGNLRRLDFKACLQSLDYDYSDADLDAIIAQIGSNGTVDFEAFCNFLSTKAADSDSKEQIYDAFKILSGDKAFVTEDDLARALPREKVDYLIKAMPLYQGQAGSYDYVAWANKSF